MSREELVQFIRTENIRNSSVNGVRKIMDNNDAYMKGEHHGFLEIYVVNPPNKITYVKDSLTVIIQYDELLHQIEALIKHVPPDTPTFIRFNRSCGDHIIPIMEEVKKKGPNNVFIIFGSS